MLAINKRGQIAIYVIIAIVIIAVVLVVVFYPRIRSTITPAEFSPYSYLKDCISPELKTAVSLLASQGGYKNPQGFILNNDIKIKYLCYTSEYYKTCVVQEPMIKNTFESELQKLVNAKANECSRALIDEYKKRSYQVSASSITSQVSIIPNKIRIEFLAPMTITKQTSQTFKSFSVDINSEIYDLLLTAQSIVSYESTLGGSETTVYLQYYPDLKIEKTKTDDGSTIYKLSNVVSKDEFTFASRSLPWPPGYGLTTP